MFEAVLAPLVFALIVLALLAYVGVRRWRRSTSESAADRDAGDEPPRQRRTGTGG